MSNRIKTADSQAAWAIVAEGVAASRMEAHHLHKLVDRVLSMVNSSTEKEHLYEVAGDSITAIPKHIEQLERQLDKTSYAVASMGKDELKVRLSLSDRDMVDEALEKAASQSVQAVAARFMQADLSPPIGYPGGPCQVIERINQEVRDPKQKETLMEKVEGGDDLSNPEAHQIYDIEQERGAAGTRFKKLLIQSHAVYRMDLRSITVPEILLCLKHFQDTWAVEKSRGSSLYKTWEQSIERGTEIRWTDKTGLVVVFAVQKLNAAGDLAARIITTFRGNESTPKGADRDSCQLPFAGWSKEYERDIDKHGSYMTQRVATAYLKA